MTGFWLGWSVGMVIALLLAVVLPPLGLLGGVLLGFGCTEACAVAGYVVWNRRTAR